MHILNPDQILPTLTQFIEPENIPRKYGGTLDWRFEEMPNLDPAMAKSVQWESGQVTIPIGPVKWERTEAGTMRMVAVGTEGGKKRRTVLGTMERKYDEVFFPVNTKVADKSSGSVEQPSQLTDSTPATTTKPGPPATANGVHA